MLINILLTLLRPLSFAPQLSQNKPTLLTQRCHHRLLRHRLIQRLKVVHHNLRLTRG